jgi:hypothetical protein
MSCSKDVVISEAVRPVIVVQDCDYIIVVAPAAQGPAGTSGADISSDSDNRLTTGTDGGLFVSDDLSPDPLNHYLLAKG